MARRVTDEQIAAFVDGHLEGTEAALVAAVLSEDEEARAYAAEVERANGLLREAFGAPMGEAVPVGLRDSILQSDDAAADRKVVALAARQPARWPLAKMAIAAGVAVAIAAGASALLVSQMTPGYQQIASLGAAPADGPLHEALERLPSGAVSDAGVQPMLTFRDAAGRICREFEVPGTVPDRLEFGIACRGDEGRWDVKIVVAAPLTEASPQGYRPASGPGGDALEAMLDALGAQPVLGPAEESELLRRGWR
jgi:hypothetical protein